MTSFDVARETKVRTETAILLTAALGMLIAPMGGVASPSDPVDHDHPPGVIVDRLAVGFEEGQADRVADAVEARGGEVLYTNDVVDFLTVKAADGQGNDLEEDLKTVEGVRYVAHDGRVEVQLTPNDPRWDDQWGAEAIGAPEAWDVETGSHDVTVAVVDTGVDYTHEDLQANFCHNGFDFIENDTDAMDVHGHGTHVAGTVAAGLDNGIGVAGISEACIMAVRVLGPGGSGSWTAVANGITYATENGADVISMSLGGFPYVPPTEPTFTAVMQHAWDEGVLIVSAAGNSGILGTGFPANYHQSMAVAALTPPDGTGVAGFSSRGPTVEIAAPGDSILSTCMGDDYCNLSGTSMAAPHVSAVAAQVWSANPALSNAEVRCILDRTADDLGVTGRDIDTGYGRVDPVEALDVATDGFADPATGAACSALGQAGL